MARSVNVSNDDDVIDSRDVIALIEELVNERERLAEAVSESREAADGADNQAPDADYDSAVKLDDRISELAEWDNEHADELKALRAFNDEGENVGGDWEHGATCVRESYFEEYARELTADIGDLPRDLPSYLVIDWKATAENLKADYSEVEFDRVTYLVRS